MSKPIVFISHITEEAKLAAILKKYIRHDFLELVDVFVSSDGESIAAGSKWLNSIDAALRRASIELVLCSRASIKRPWINFEAGAGWIRDIPVIPICHSGLSFDEMSIPLRALDGVQANEEVGLRRIYSLIASKLDSAKPPNHYDALITDIKAFEKSYAPRLNEITKIESDKEKAILERMVDALRSSRFKWRTVERLAYKAAISQDEAADILRRIPDVIFGKGKDGKLIARLKS